MDARPQKAVLQEISHSLVVATADHGFQRSRRERSCLTHRCTLVKHWTQVHEKLYSKKSATRLLWRQLGMVCEAIAQSEVVSLTDSPLSSTGARPQKAELQEINHSLVVVATADHGFQRSRRE